MDISLNPGDLAPDFILPDADENLIRLSDFRGKQVVLSKMGARRPAP